MPLDHTKNMPTMKAITAASAIVGTVVLFTSFHNNADYLPSAGAYRQLRPKSQPTFINPAYTETTDATSKQQQELALLTPIAHAASAALELAVLLYSAW